MRKYLTAMAVAGAVAACDGNPFLTTDDTAADTTDTTSTIPPGTTNPAANVSIFRYEPFDAATGSGYAESISYDATADRFFVDNLAFDGDNFYERDDLSPSIGKDGPMATGPFQVYENDSFLSDPVTGTPINQFQHKAIRGVSTTGDTEFAIVRTGQYVNYGFGGFIYQRNSGVTLPTSGQAFYSGEAAGLRDFLARGGLEYTSAEMAIAIDFEDLNDGDAVRGNLFNRRVFEIQFDAFGNETGTNDITTDIVNAINANPAYAAVHTELPTLFFTVQPGVLDTNGELIGELQSSLIGSDGNLVTYESGNYYALVEGATADEIVGVVVVTSTDPRVQSGAVTARETSGFIVYRN
ncbi:MAG: hypothetical protein QNJ44_23440 [Rhodobacter sp.]|nr:hypothetical protein [Rhodobacter sp.]